MSSPTSRDANDAPHDAAAAEGLSEQELAEIEARANAATPGPWLMPRQVDGYPYHNERNDDRVRVDHEGCPVWPWLEEEDMIFAYRARDDVPRLIAEIRRLRHALRVEAGSDREA